MDLRISMLTCKLAFEAVSGILNLLFDEWRGAYTTTDGADSEPCHEALHNVSHLYRSVLYFTIHFQENLYTKVSNIEQRQLPQHMTLLHFHPLKLGPKGLTVHISRVSVVFN